MSPCDGRTDMVAVVFPLHAEALTPELLTAALLEQRPRVIVEGLRVVEEAHCDTGSASTAARGTGIGLCPRR